jgi:hypothetical protein
LTSFYQFRREALGCLDFVFQVKRSSDEIGHCTDLISPTGLQETSWGGILWTVPINPFHNNKLLVSKQACSLHFKAKHMKTLFVLLYMVTLLLPAVSFSADGEKPDSLNSLKCDDAFRYLFSEGVVEHREYIRKNAKFFELSDIIKPETQVIYLGEEHIDPVPKLFLEKRMKSLKRAGITHIALEMFASNHQAQIDAYLRGQENRENILEILRTEWGWQTSFIDYPSSLMRVIDAAKSEGVGILAVDSRRGKELMLSNENYRTPEKHRKYLEGMSLRDSHMVGVIADFFKINSTAKVLFLIGQDHVLDMKDLDNPFFPNQSRLLEQHGISSKVYLFASGRSSATFRMEELHISTGSTFLPVSREEEHVDGHIYLDEVLRPPGH